MEFDEFVEVARPGRRIRWRTHPAGGVPTERIGTIVDWADERIRVRERGIGPLMPGVMEWNTIVDPALVFDVLPADTSLGELEAWLARPQARLHGADVKVVQARLRHASARTTLDTYSHHL